MGEDFQERAQAPVLETDLLRGATMVTFTGVVFPLAAPGPEHVRIEDIAHALARLCRFNGACGPFYSVAQHSVLASSWVWDEWLKTEAAPRLLAQPPDRFNPGAKRWQLEMTALLHDATEAYCGDVIRPLKRLLRSRGGDVFDEIEDRIWKAVAERFGVPAEMEPIVKVVDNRMCATEQRDLMRMPPGWVPAHEPFDARLYGWEVETAEHEFLDMFDEHRDVDETGLVSR
jgi:hypothetical protein